MHVGATSVRSNLTFAAYVGGCFSGLMAVLNINISYN